MTSPSSFTYSPCPECRKLNRVSIGGPQSAGRQPVCGSCKSVLPLHGAINEVSAAGLMALVEKSPLPVIADFWAPWCGPCRTFAPAFEMASRELAGEAVLAKVDTEAHALASSSYGIRGIPTLIVFWGGFERARRSGAMPLQMFLAWARGVIQGRAAA